MTVLRAIGGRLVAAALGAVVLAAPAAAQDLSGRLLVAGPEMADPNFSRSVVYMLRDGADGSYGVIVNRPGGVPPLGPVLDGFGLEVPDDLDEDDLARLIPVLVGGPVEIRRGAILHTGDWSDETTESPDGRYGLSYDIRALARFDPDGPPRRFALVLGYAGWAPGQLQGEIDRGDWLVAPADEDLVLSDNPTRVWEEALERSGLDT